MSFYTASHAALREADDERIRRDAAAGDPDAIKALSQLQAREGDPRATILLAVRKLLVDNAAALGYRFVREQLPERDGTRSFTLRYPGTRFSTIPDLAPGLEVTVQIAYDRPYRLVNLEVYPYAPQALRDELDDALGSDDAWYEWVMDTFQETSKSVYLDHMAHTLPIALKDLKSRLKHLPAQVSDFIRVSLRSNEIGDLDD